MPFDRHEWTVDRCGTGLFKYHVDFYDGAQDPNGRVNIYLDARPAMDNITGVLDRLKIGLHQLLGQYRVLDSLIVEEGLKITVHIGLW